MRHASREIVAGSGAAALATTVDSRDGPFIGMCVFLFIASAWGTIYLCGSMSGGMPMPGGWTMSMAWMRMPGQTWPGAAACFMQMWLVMMVAMMLPSLAPMLSRYRRALCERDTSGVGGMTTLAGTGYFLVWAIVGAIAYPLGATLAAAEMRWQALARCVPMATGGILLCAGCIQLTAWKARQLECWQGGPPGEASLPVDTRSAWRLGLRLGTHCASCCCGYMIILLGTGVMDLAVMALVAAAITFERLAPKPARAARAAGVVIITLGILVIARAIGMV